jgi:hypothetical protein
MYNVVVYKRMLSCNHVDVPIFTLHHKILFKKSFEVAFRYFLSVWKVVPTLTSNER